MTSRFVFSNEEIVREDTTGDEMYFIEKGLVQIYSKHCDFAVKALADGCYFGDVACLLNVRRTATVKARTNSSLVVVTKKGLKEALNDHPKMHERMLRTARKRHLRLVCLDEETGAKLEFTDDDLEDEEDAGTKFFKDLGKVESRQPQESKAALTPASGSSSKLTNFFRVPSSNFLRSSSSDKIEGGDQENDCQAPSNFSSFRMKTPPSPRKIDQRALSFSSQPSEGSAQIKMFSKSQKSISCNKSDREEKLLTVRAIVRAKKEERRSSHDRSVSSSFDHGPRTLSRLSESCPRPTVHHTHEARVSTLPKETDREKNLSSSPVKDQDGTEFFDPFGPDFF